MSDLGNILDFIDSKNTEEIKVDSKRSERQIDKVISNIHPYETKEIELEADKSSYATEITKANLFNDFSIAKNKEIQVDTNTVKAAIKEQLSKILNLQKMNFVFEGNVFQDYGIKDNECYHIFLVLNDMEINSLVVKKMISRAVMIVDYKMIHNIVLYSIIKNKLLIYKTKVDKELLNYLGGK